MLWSRLCSKHQLQHLVTVCIPQKGLAFGLTNKPPTPSKTQSTSPRHPRGQQNGAIIHLIDNSLQGKSSQNSIFPALLNLNRLRCITHPPPSLPSAPFRRWLQRKQQIRVWSHREVLGQKATVWVYRTLLSLHSRCVLVFLVPVTALCSHTSRQGGCCGFSMQWSYHAAVILHSCPCKSTVELLCCKISVCPEQCVEHPFLNGECVNSIFFPSC